MNGWYEVLFWLPLVSAARQQCSITRGVEWNPNWMDRLIWAISPAREGQCCLGRSLDFGMRYLRLYYTLLLVLFVGR